MDDLAKANFGTLTFVDEIGEITANSIREFFHARPNERFA